MGCGVRWRVDGVRDLVCGWFDPCSRSAAAPPPRSGPHHERIWGRLGRCLDQGLSTNGALGAAALRLRSGPHFAWGLWGRLGRRLDQGLSTNGVLGGRSCRCIGAGSIACSFGGCHDSVWIGPQSDPLIDCIPLPQMRGPVGRFSGELRSACGWFDPCSRSAAAPPPRSGPHHERILGRLRRRLDQGLTTNGSWAGCAAASVRASPRTGFGAAAPPPRSGPHHERILGRLRRRLDQGLSTNWVVGAAAPPPRSGRHHERILGAAAPSPRPGSHHERGSGSALLPPRSRPHHERGFGEATPRTRSGPHHERGSGAAAPPLSGTRRERSLGGGFAAASARGPQRTASASAAWAQGPRGRVVGPPCGRDHVGSAAARLEPTYGELRRFVECGGDLDCEGHGLRDLRPSDEICGGPCRSRPGFPGWFG